MSSEYVFISYSSKEYDQADALKEALEAHNIPCWMAPDSIVYGSNYASAIPSAIRGCTVFLLLLSNASQESLWVPREIDVAVNKKKLIIPYMLENCEITDMFDFYLIGYQRLEGFRNPETALKQLIKRITKELHIAPAAPVEKTPEVQAPPAPVEKVPEVQTSPAPVEKVPEVQASPAPVEKAPEIQAPPASVEIEPEPAPEVYEPAPIDSSACGLSQQDVAEAPEASKQTQTPKPEILPSGKWRCTCSRINERYVSTCACGMNKWTGHADTPIASPKPAPKSKTPQKDPTAEKWICKCGRQNAGYVSTCACGTNKWDQLSPKKDESSAPPAESQPEIPKSQVADTKPGILPSGRWRCTCGRINESSLAECSCGVSKTGNAPEAHIEVTKAAKLLPSGKWQCSCGRINERYVSSCACGATKRDAAPPVYRPSGPWTCKCGRKNESYVNNCVCGNTKFNN